MSHIELIGVSGPIFDARQQELIAGCEAVVASRRQQAMLKEFNLVMIPVTPIGAMVELVRQHLDRGNVAVLASGDPLFYGIGRTLLDHFPPEQVRIHPALSALQLACARFRTPWDDLTIISLHGRDMGDIPGRILPHGKVMLFTDGTNSPDRVCHRLLTALKRTGDDGRIQNIQVDVAENLGLEDEQLTSGTLEQIAEHRFSPLNMMLVRQELPLSPGCFGLSETDIHHSRGLITKDEVRAASLHKLNLPPQGVLWDIGGGSGSVSLEAARLNPDLAVYTIERKTEEQNNILANIRRYNTYNIHLIDGEAPDMLRDLPAPDRVFIGGSGSRLEEIITYAGGRLNPGGIIVANAVLAKTAEQAPRYLLQQGFTVETTKISVTRKQFGSEDAITFNPITIITGRS